jgi:hypothetical protein
MVVILRGYNIRPVTLFNILAMLPASMPTFILTAHASDDDVAQKLKVSQSFSI